MKGPHPTDLATAATTIAWDMSADLFPDRTRRRQVRAGAAGLGTAALAWLERDMLKQTAAELRSVRDLQQRIAAARTEEELDAVMAEVPDETSTPATDAKAAWAPAGIVVGSLAAEVVLRRWTKRRIAAGVRLPRLPAALCRAGLAFVVGPATRALDDQSRT